MCPTNSACTPPGPARLNAAEEAALRPLLREICTSAAWVGDIAAHRPYPDTDALLAASDAAVARMDAADLAEALAGHPPIGRPVPGDAVSAREQRGMSGADAGLKADMLRLNLAYQEKFGHVFLVCATGRSAEELRDAARTRLDNPPDREREVVREELRKINRIRLVRLVTEHQAEEVPATVSTHVLDTSTGRPAAGVDVELAVRTVRTVRTEAGTEPHDWVPLGTATTDADGRCAALPVPPPTATHARLRFAVAPHLEGTRKDGAFFPEVVVAFALAKGEHHHIPLLLSPFGYSVYRGS
ncbi:2-oxo-4-hydroxy-4-carboxy-5-ureidoimidazoline decarboxylase [Streptomyces gamaensis]|uniref:2-oxo-4-hydroxy-4-carboxy-5-ureidoimidazoline decarboxylase n=1 Tax=Streptomyces gamaensis TaxID=1763542 RepID=A0ABW0YRJ2_9ACTN